MGSLSSRRKPWPWDARIVSSDLSQGVMLLAQPDSSLLIARKQTNLENLYPSTAEYDSAPVYRERTFQFRPTAGLGQPTQSSPAERRYHYGINVWVTGGLFGLGPKVHPVLPAGMAPTPTRAGMCRRFIEARIAGVDQLFYITNQEVFVRNDDTDAGQAVSRARAGHYPTDMARFTGAFAGAVDSLYVAWEDGVLEQFDGTAWVACTLPTGFGANFLEVIAEELWAADSARVVIRKVTGDPKVSTEWGGPIIIGTPSEHITAIRQTNNQLAIFKDDGSVFGIGADGSATDLFPGLLTTRDMDNGRTAVAWLNSLWFRASRAWYELDMSSASITPRGPGRNLGNLSEVRGAVQAFAGWNTQMAFAVIYNQQLNNSYLLSYGSWVPKADPATQNTTLSGTSYTFLDQYDGAVKRWVGRQVTSCFVSNIPNEARLYVGFLDGGYDWLRLVPYPLLPDPDAEYTLEESYLVVPLHHAMFQSDDKHWSGVSIFGPNMVDGDRVTVEYRVVGRSVGAADPTGGYSLFGQPQTQNGQRMNPSQLIAGSALDLKIGFSTNEPNHSPALEGVGIHERLVPRFRRDWTLTVNANDHVARRDGATTRQSGVTIRKWMEQAASAPATVSLQLPDETLDDVAFFAYEEHQTPHSQRGGQGYAITVQATQFQLVDLYGIIRRFRGTRIGDLRGYKIEELRLL
jgi:hypothetical protein